MVSKKGRGGGRTRQRNRVGITRIRLNPVFPVTEYHWSEEKQSQKGGHFTRVDENQFFRRLLSGSFRHSETIIVVVRRNENE